MLRSLAVFRQSLFILALALLFMTMGVSLQDATAQTLTFDEEQPTASLKRALLVAEDDSQLVDLATALMEARADTKISYEEYRSGVRLFQEHHPGFYGNFFGDPFYATYDVRYQTLAWERQMAEPDINPVNSFRTSDWFFCHPLGYDPAFNGQCRGFAFAVSDFFFLPAGPAFGQQNFASIRDRTQLLATRGDGTVRSRAVSPAPHTPDTSRGPVGDTPTPERPLPERPPSEAVETTAANASPSSARAPRTGLSDHPSPRIDVPDDVLTSMQETASSFKRTETILRIQQAIERRRERGPLSFRERVRVAQQIAADQGMDELTRTMSRARHTLADPEDRRALVQQLDRNEIEREARRTVNRSSELGTRESTQPRSSVQRRSKEPASSGSRRSRSRSSENSSDNG